MPYRMPDHSAQGCVPVISGAVGWNEIVFYGEMFKSQRIIAFVAVDLRPFTGAAPFLQILLDPKNRRILCL